MGSTAQNILEVGVAVAVLYPPFTIPIAVISVALSCLFR